MGLHAWRHETWDHPSSSRYQGQGALIITPPPSSFVILRGSLPVYIWYRFVCYFEGDFCCGGFHSTVQVMVLIKEYRVVLPVSVEEHQVVVLSGWRQQELDRRRRRHRGSTGRTVRGGRRKRTVHPQNLSSKEVPAFVKMMAPEGSFVLHEKAWKAYP